MKLSLFIAAVAVLAVSQSNASTTIIKGYTVRSDNSREVCDVSFTGKAFEITEGGSTSLACDPSATPDFCMSTPAGNGSGETMLAVFKMADGTIAGFGCNVKTSEIPTN